MITAGAGNCPQADLTQLHLGIYSFAHKNGIKTMGKNIKKSSRSTEKETKGEIEDKSQ